MMLTAYGTGTGSHFYHFKNGRIPVIVHVPHASTHFPKNVLEEGVKLNTKNDLKKGAEIIADKHMHTVARRIFNDSGLKPYWFESRISRMFMDPERFNNHDEPMNDAGMGIVYTKNHDGDNIYSTPPTVEQCAQRVRKFYDTYSEAFSNAVDHILHHYGKCLIIDAHSYASTALPYEMHTNETRTPLVLGYDDDHSRGVRSSLMELEQKFYVSSNTVFKGSYVPLKHLNKSPAVSSVMFELRKDVYMNENSGLLLNNGNSELLNAINEDMISLAKSFSK